MSAIAFLFASSSYAMSVEFYKTESDKQTLGIYVKGIGDGFLWMSSLHEAKGADPLYCPPSKLVISSENYVSILDRQIKRIKYDQEFPLGMALLNGLIYTFPCPKK